MKKLLVKRIWKSITDKRGFTLLETIITLCITSVFFVGTASVLTTSSEMYLSSIKSSAARGAVETAADDIKNSILSGKDIKLIFYMDGTRGSITGSSTTGTSITVNLIEQSTGLPLPEGTILYTDGTYVKPTGNGTFSLSPDEKEALESVAEGVDLGFKKIYILPTAGEQYKDTVHGLPYGLKFYRGAELKLLITKSSPQQGFQYDLTVPERKKEEEIYNISLTGYDKQDIYVVKSSIATAALNDADYN